jgi:DNA polymerase I-like protein with 3'-5' exonuclease and polymerase domains
VNVLELILEIRKIGKVIGTYVCAAVDHRNRFLTGVNLALETGRTSTSILKVPVFTEPTGLAFQTITKHGEQGSDIRSMMIPDPGYVFFESDLSGAEAYVVAELARDEKMKKMFKYGIDLHRVTTGWLINSCPDDLLELFFLSQNDEECKAMALKINGILKALINGEVRQIGKKFRHAGHYDMGKREASLQTGVSEWKAGEFLKKFHDSNPNIRGVFHADIKKALQDNNRVLVTPHGRRRQFFNEWGDELFKEAYADIPQGTVSDHLKFAAQRIEKRCPWIQILVESHDSFTCLAPIDIGAQYPMAKIDKLKEVTTEELSTPIDFKHCTLSRGVVIIPNEMFIGKDNWLNMERIY